MYFTHKFLDPSVKTEGVKSNTVDMIFAYFWSAQQLDTNFTGMTLAEISDTKDWIRQWVDDNYNVIDLMALADFVSRLVTDYRENQADLRGN